MRCGEERSLRRGVERRGLERRGGEECEERSLRRGVERRGAERRGLERRGLERRGLERRGGEVRRGEESEERCVTKNSAPYIRTGRSRLGNISKSNGGTPPTPPPADDKPKLSIRSRPEGPGTPANA